MMNKIKKWSKFFNYILSRDQLHAGPTLALLLSHKDKKHFSNIDSSVEIKLSSDPFGLKNKKFLCANSREHLTQLCSYVNPVTFILCPLDKQCKLVFFSSRRKQIKSKTSCPIYDIYDNKGT